MDAVAFFKCLADTTRLRIALLTAREGELCVCELTAALAESQPKVSRHLAFLRTAGVLDSRRQGQWMYYRLADQLPDWARDVLGAVIPADMVLAQEDRQRLALMNERPLRQASCC